MKFSLKRLFCGKIIYLYQKDTGLKIIDLDL